MTEQEWMECADPQEMLEFLCGKASGRKLRLFALACCRRIWHLLGAKASRKAVEVAELYADGCANDEQLWAVSRAATSVGIGYDPKLAPANAVHFAAKPGQVRAARCAEEAARAVNYLANPSVQASLLRRIFGNFFRSNSRATESSGYDKDPAETSQQASLVRCIFGNPFKSVAVNSAWLTPVVKQLAFRIYDQRAFDRMPILLSPADSLHLFPGSRI